MPEKNIWCYNSYLGKESKSKIKKTWVRANLEAKEDDGTSFLENVQNDKSL